MLKKITWLFQENSSEIGFLIPILNYQTLYTKLQVGIISRFSDTLRYFATRNDTDTFDYVMHINELNCFQSLEANNGEEHHY